MLKHGISFTEGFFPATPIRSSVLRCMEGVSSHKRLALSKSLMMESPSERVHDWGKYNQYCTVCSMAHDYANRCHTPF